MKILAVVISFYPDIEDLEHNISSYIDIVDALIVWENTPQKDKLAYRLHKNLYPDKLLYMGEEGNVYIARALNNAVLYAKKNGFTHILTMDQDSCFETEHFKKFAKIVESESQMCIWGPELNVYKGVSDSLVVRDLPTSGNLIDLKIFDEIGLYNETYAIDCVDFEFCYRAARKGILSKKAGSIIMHHSVGQDRKTIWGFCTRDYSVDRLYHISRNNIWLYRDFPELGFHNIKEWILKVMIKIILGESKKCVKISSMLRGISDGFRMYNKINIKQL